MAGWAGKILKIDLTEQEIVKETTPLDLVETFLGGAGLGAYFLFNLVSPEVKADSPENCLAVATGPLNGTIVPSSGRLSITTLSPVTGIFTDSNSGGDFAPELKYAGYDMILITGKAKQPLYLRIDDDRVELKDARHLIGKDTWETEEQIKKELDDQRVKTALVGPSAWKGVLYGSLIINRYRACGKTGIGTVFVQKNLLGIVVRGRKGIAIHDPVAFEAAVDRLLNSMRNSASYPEYSNLGTMGVADVYQESGRLPVRNRQQAGLPEDLYEDICSDAFLKKAKVRDVSCFNCPVHCSHWFEIKEGKYAGEMGEKPELVALEAFGTLLGAHDLGAICHLQNESNRFGFDMMECGNTMALAFEAYEKGLISLEDTDGIPLEWGNQDAIEKLFYKIANFEGIGRIFGLGVKRTAQWIGKGADRFAIQVKGYGMSLVEIRNAPHWGLAFATASRGGDHLKALPVAVGEDRQMFDDLFGDQPTEEITSLMKIKGKGKLVAWFENYNAVLDALGLCKLACKVGWIHPKDLADALGAATGISFDLKRMMACGERICNLQKAFNARLGLTRKDDTVPVRFLEEPISTGPRKGKHLGEVFPRMLDEYYDAKGWNKETSLPTRSKLESLGLKWLADELEKSGHLAKE